MGDAALMDWEREPWRKLYTRETSSWAALDHEAQACLMMFIKTCEPDGTIGGDARQVARFWRWPVEFVSKGLEQLAGVGTVERTANNWALVNFEEAQAARTGSTERSRRKRENDRAKKRKEANKGGTPGDAEGLEGTPRDARGRIEKNRIEKNRRELTTATATTGNSTITRLTANRAPWPVSRALLDTLTDDLHKRVRWPLSAPQGYTDALTYCGDLEALSEALRRVSDGIKKGQIEPDRWHARMFYGRAWPALMMKLDELETQSAVRERRQKEDEQRWTENEQNKQQVTPDEFEQMAKVWNLDG